MRIRQIVNTRIDQAYTDAFNAATSNNLTLAEMQDAAFALMSDETLQGDLALALEYKRKVEVTLQNLQRLAATANTLGAVEEGTITQAVTDLGTIFQTPYDDIPQE